MLIGTLSERTGCHIETIRYYERIKLLPKPPRTEGGTASMTGSKSNDWCLSGEAGNWGFRLTRFVPFYGWLMASGIRVRRSKRLQKPIWKMSKGKSLIYGGFKKHSLPFLVNAKAG